MLHFQILSSIQKSLTALVADTSNHYTIHHRIGETPVRFPVADIEIAFRDGVVRFGVPFFYSMDRHWDIMVHPHAYVFGNTERGSRRGEIYIDRFALESELRAVPYTHTVLYKTTAETRLLFGRDDLQPLDPVYVLRVYHKKLVFADVSAESETPGTDPFSPKAFKPHVLLEQDGAPLLQSALFRWWCLMDEMQGHRGDKHTTYSSVAHRMLLVPTMRVGMESSIRLRIESLLGEFGRQHPLYVAYLVGMFENNPNEFRNMLHALLDTTEARRTELGMRRPGRPRVTRLTPHKLGDDGLLLPPWIAAKQKY